MNKKLEINLDSWTSKIMLSFDKIKSEDFKEHKSLFNFFDINGDGEISSDEINNIVNMKLQTYAFKNQNDTRKNADSIFDEQEAQQFIENSTAKSGKSFAELGVTVDDVFNFMNMVYKKFVKEEETTKEQETIKKRII